MLAIYYAGIGKFDPGLHLPNTPLLAFALKWIYCILLLIGLNIKQVPIIRWRLVNFACIGAILLYVSLIINFRFYPSIFLLPIIEIISLIVLIYTNKRELKTNWNIHLRLLDYLIVLVPLLLTTFICILIIKHLFEIGYLY